MIELKSVKWTLFHSPLYNFHFEYQTKQWTPLQYPSVRSSKASFIVPNAFKKTVNLPIKIPVSDILRTAANASRRLSLLQQFDRGFFEIRESTLSLGTVVCWTVSSAIKTVELSKAVLLGRPWELLIALNF